MQDFYTSFIFNRPCFILIISVLDFFSFLGFFLAFIFTDLLIYYLAWYTLSFSPSSQV